MNFQSMNYFLQVAEKRSFSQAAEALYITQQTLSAAIASLEKEVGCPLFVRHIPLELTYGGELFRQYARSMLQMQEHMLRDFAEIREEVRGRLRVGIAINRGRLLMPAVIRAFHETWPLVEVEIDEHGNDELMTVLAEGGIDLAIANFTGTPHGTVLEDFYTDEVVLAISEKLLQETFGSRTEEVKAGLLASQDLSLLTGVPFLMSKAQGVAGRIGRSLIRQARITPAVRATSGNLETLMEMCVLGEGACFCAENLLRNLFPAARAEDLFLLHFPGRETVYSVRFGWLQEEKEWKIRRAFIDTAKRVFPAGALPLPAGRN